MQKDAISECIKAAHLLKEIESGRVPPIPKGWFTKDQFASQIGVGRTAAQERLVLLMKSGSLIFKKWPVLDRTGRVNYTNIYKTK